MFSHQELRYYSFGLRAGLSNFLANGLALGARKTLGKISQPINAPSRFPEYHWFDAAIRDHLAARSTNGRSTVLDVGSPKLLGLYLAATIRADVTLTDISEPDVNEYRTMWRGLERRAIGTAAFSRQDARSLEFPDAAFDIVYSMSVVEHVEGPEGDAAAVREMLRVLKPGGLLIMSVPFGHAYVEQRRGSSGFFQRIYDRPAFEQRILRYARELDGVHLTTVSRRKVWLWRGFGALGQNARGLLGFANPLLSAAINQSSPGICPVPATRYGQIHRANDVYGDLILAGRRK